MQVNRYIVLPKNSLISHKLFFVGRLIILIAATAYLWQSFTTNRQLLFDMQSVSLKLTLSSVMLLGLVFLLLPLNWLMEAGKWRIIAGVSKLSFLEALKGVLTGVTLDNILPLSTGAISGRLLSLKKEYRIITVPGILFGQLVQSVVTFLFGLLGFYAVWRAAPHIFTWNSSYTIFTVGTGLLVVLILLFWKKKLILFLAPIRDYSLNSWLTIAVLTTARYLCFLLQFILLILFFDPDFEFALAFACATWVFAARTFMPKVSNLERLGIRALAVILFADIFGLSSIDLLMAVTALWFINLAIPSLIGLVILGSLKKENLYP